VKYNLFEWFDFRLGEGLLNIMKYCTYKFHRHIHMLASDGLFTKNGAFYVAPDIDLKPLEEIFRANVFKMLKKEGKINDDVINNLLSWRHSGFSVDNGVRIVKDDEEGQIALAQYILRNTLSDYWICIFSYSDTSNMHIQSVFLRSPNE